MPYRGDSPVEAWEFWFDHPPSDEVRQALNCQAENHAVSAIIEAIEITFDKRTITTDLARLRYINGILQRKTLETVAPKRAEEERQIDLLQHFWKRRGVPFPGYWIDGTRRRRDDRLHFRKQERAIVASWLGYCTVPEIEAVMSVARSWDDLSQLLDGIAQRRHKTHRRVLRATFRDLVMVLTEFVSLEEVGYVLSFQNSQGDAIGLQDTTPRALASAILIACRKAVEYVGDDYVDADQIFMAVKDSWVETTVPHDSISAQFKV